MENVKRYNNELIKRKNRGQVFQQIVMNNGVTRMNLAKECNMSKMTISYIVNEFFERDIVIELAGNDEKKPGKNSSLLFLSPKAKKIVGLLIHRNFISATLCDCQLNVIRADKVCFSECDKETLMQKAFELTDKMIEGENIIGIGIGAIGPISLEQGLILEPPDFYGIHDVPVVQLFSERYGLPVYLDYHYNCVARAEKYFGKGKNYRNFILLGIEGGIGISIVVDGRILTRFTGISSELGHVTVDYNGRQCSCGRRGCLGRYIKSDNRGLTWETVRALYAALSGICDLVSPHALIIRDEVNRLRDEQLEWLEEELNKNSIIHNYQRIDVCRSSRSNELEAANCAANILGRVFSGEIEF